MDTIHIPFTIKRLRQAGLTQTQIGRELGLSQTSISDMEAGKYGTTRPSFQTVSGLLRLAAEHNIPTSPSETASQPQ